MNSLFKAGDLVRLRKDSVLYGTFDQIEGIGEITRIYKDGYYPISVQDLDSGVSNYYLSTDLEVV